MEPKINIYVSYHKDFMRLPVKHYIPIQVGAKINPKLNMIGDDYNKDDNISEKQPRYSDVTSHYHALKNDIDGDYIGFIHYRRMFYFAKPGDELLTNDIIKDAVSLGIGDEGISQIVKQFDILVPPSIGYNVNVYSYLCNNYTKGLMDMFIEVIKDLYPEYKEALSTYLNGHEGFYYNMFIMKREYFLEYGKFKFDCLNELEKRLERNEIPDLFPRLFGFLSEFFITIYILYKNSKKPLRITTLPLLIIEEENEKGEYNYHLNHFHLPE